MKQFNFSSSLIPRLSILTNPISKRLPPNLQISLMAEPETLIPNLSEMMEEYAPPEGEVHLEPTGEDKPTEQPEVQPVARQQKRKGKERQQEEEKDDFVSEEAYSIWKKHYAGKGFIGERGFSQLISLCNELIEQRGWEKFCKHRKTGYAAVVREFYSNLVGRKENSVFVRGVWVHMELQL